ncbi:MAG: DUF6600 domain-containing protein [Spirochaetia bacterium]
MTTGKNRVGMISLMLVLFLSVLAYADPPSLVGRLNLAQGSVSFRPGSLDEWAPAVLNYPLTAGDHLWTDASSRAELHVGSTAVRLDAGTEMSFLNLDDQTVQIAVSQGQMNVRLRRLDPGDAMEIDTPNSVVTLLEPGNYTLNVQSEQGSSLTVWSGQAQVTAAGNDIAVPAGQTASVSGSGSIAYYLQPASGPDAWDAWCASRDAREGQLASARYVPREMIGIEDLDENGSWIVMAGYGPVWAPQRVAPGWAPYKFGHWAWVAPWGWTWIDDAPWGFAPFHYGRWAFVDTRWVWIPGSVVERPVYAPALVVFIGGEPGDPSAEGIGWFPLGPREVYVPPYGASTRYVQRVNVTTVTITEENIQRIDVRQVTYVNRGVPSAVTVVPRQSFTQGRQANGAPISFSMDQVRRAPVMGMGATIPPQRESIIGQPMPGGGPARQPPPQVMGRSVFGRIVPAPAPAPFMFRPEPLPPATMYQRPPQQVAPQPTGPVRQRAPIMINPMNRGPGFQAPPPGGPQPQAGPQRPGGPQPQTGPQGPVPQPGPGPRLPAPQGPGVQPQQPQPLLPQPGPGPRVPAPQGQGVQPQQPQPLQPQQGPGPRVPAPQGQGVQPQQPQPLLPQPGPGPRVPAPQGQGVQPLQPQPGPGPRVPAPQGNKPQPANKGGGEAGNLLNILKTQNLPAVQSRLDSARKVPGVKLDFAAVSHQLDAARSAITAAESALSGGKSDAALQQAQAAQRQLADVDRQLSDALKSSSGGTTGNQPIPPGQRQGDAPGNTR